jgi:Lar family restriction alleviation protein
MSEALKPCPFCGGEARVVSYGDPHESPPLVVVMCDECEATTGDGIARESAIAAWNLRGSPEQEEGR